MFKMVQANVFFYPRLIQRYRLSILSLGFSYVILCGSRVWMEEPLKTFWKFSQQVSSD